MKDIGGFLTLMLAALSPASALDLRLCPDRLAGFDRFTEQAFVEELGRILTVSGKTLRVLPCESPSPEALRLRVKARPQAEQPADALGAARINQQGRILPECAVYVSPVAQLVGTRLPAVLGKSLARVAAHELGHYLHQREQHDHDGLMTESFTAPLLLAASPGHFRIR